MVSEEPVPEYTDEGSLQDDLLRIAAASRANNAAIATTLTATQNISNNITVSVEGIAPVANSGNPDTDELIQRLMREDAEEDAAATGQPSVVAGAPPDIIKTFFDCIKNENSELISAFIDGGLVKPNTKNRDGVTPLVAAVRANHIRVVQQLVDYGADVDEMTEERDPDVPYLLEYRHGIKIPNSYEKMYRTPLMAAAENGHMPLVKLFVEVFHARDDIVPPDGMTALRLAAKNGHREIVEFLPSRRIGGMERWKYKNRNSLRRARVTWIELTHFLRTTCYEIPRFFVWYLPKHYIFNPIRYCLVYLWKHKKQIAVGTKNGIVKGIKGVGRLAKKAAVETVRGIKAIPSVTARAAKAVGRGVVTGIKAIWKFLTVGLPKSIVAFIKGTVEFIKKAAIWTKDVTVATVKALKKLTVWMVKQLWKTLTVRIPNAITIIAKWFWTGIKRTGAAIGDFMMRIISAIHTLISKIIDWASGITWKDVVNGFTNTLRWIFVDVPLMIGAGFKATVNGIKKVLEALFGFFGKVIYYLGLGIVMLIIYVPRKIFELFVELIKSIGNGLHEIAVWINPKTI
ncbi:Ankyrin-1 [Arthrobotrys entomopaga]|nr:Ankyrin-1 [Arthrobotrys entomopaga]